MPESKSGPGGVEVMESSCSCMAEVYAAKFYYWKVSMADLDGTPKIV